ncbi:MAG: precorrin-6y C5,15-methyltransferase (decarboxylating) subunit CbiE [Pseudomonadota bacterium]
MNPWLHVVGIGEDGWTGLSSAARAALEAAEIVIGGNRHHALAPHLKGKRIHWPSPFRELVDSIPDYRGRRVAVLVTGDPLWFSAGSLMMQIVSPDEIVFHPQLSAFQWAAAHMRWSLADVETLTVHGRRVERIAPHIAPGQRLLILTRDGDSPSEICDLLIRAGCGSSRVSALCALGGRDEQRIDAIAATWPGKVPDFHTLAIEVIGDPDARPPPRWGLPDEVFVHDGKMTKREVRILTLAALAPRQGELLWDIGAGCGSVGIEWLRAARNARAVGLEPLAQRRALAATNAQKLGAPHFDIRNASAPEGFADLPDPDAIFIGGGLSVKMIKGCIARLKPFGRLVANAVTLESEALLTETHASYGGDLIRVAVNRAENIGRYRGWRAQMPVTQWILRT